MSYLNWYGDAFNDQQDSRDWMNDMTQSEVREMSHDNTILSYRENLIRKYGE